MRTMSGIIVRNWLKGWENRKKNDYIKGNKVSDLVTQNRGKDACYSQHKIDEQIPSIDGLYRLLI